ncbi:MAG: peptidoglycan-binding protein, partial [Calditrichia bacterium]
MALEKAFIQPLDDKGSFSGSPVRVLFNPKEYTLEKSNQYQSTALPGLSTPINQFVSGNAATLSMELFFDTYEKGEDVRNHTGLLTGLLNINSDLHAPPPVMFIWGKLQFKAVLERVSQRFTLFLSSGIPVRAALNVSFREFKTISEQLSAPPRQSADRSKQRILKDGESLWLIAFQEYGDA